MERIDSFRLEWIVDGCGGTLNQPEGEFTSPGYPGFYPPSTTCEWNIVADYGYIIEITIVDFWFEVSKSCALDALAVCIKMFKLKIIFQNNSFIKITVETMILVQNCYGYVINKPVQSL